MPRLIPMTLALAVAACSPLPDTVGEAAPTATLWQLDQVDDAPAPYAASLRLLNSGRVIGTGPCNRFTATQKAPLPWVEFTEIEAGSRRCEGDAEARFFAALRSMDFAEVAGDSLLLSNAEGDSLLLSNAEGGSLFFRASVPAS